MEETSPRVIQPKYDFDPEGHYADPQVQAWANYYAQGGTDKGGAKYFISVPGLKLDGEQTSTSRGMTESRPLLTIDTTLSRLPIPASSEDFEFLRSTYGVGDANTSTNVPVRCDFVASRSDEVTVRAGDVVCVVHRFQDEWSLVKNGHGQRGVVPTDCLLLEGTSSVLRLPRPRTPSSLSRLTPLRSPVSDDDDGIKRKSKRSVLGLLELVHVTRRSKSKESEDRNTTLASAATRTRRSLRSALKTQSDLKGEEPHRRVRFSSSPIPNTESQSSTSSGISSSPIPALIISNAEPDEEDISNYSPVSPNALPPRYEEVQSLAGTWGPSLPEAKTSLLRSYTDSTFQTNRPSVDSKTLPIRDEKVSLDAVEPTSVPAVVSNVFVMHSVTEVTGSTLLAESISSKNIIYRNTLSFLFKQVSSTDPLWGTLHEYYISLQSLDSVSSLVQSRDYRANLLQVASALDISEDGRIREALQKDESEIAGVLHVISQSDTSRHAVLALEGDDAQKFLDVVQDVLDKGYLLNSEENARARRLLVRLSETCDKLPSSLFIKGVERPDELATFGGGFGDVYRATYNGKHVALKRMRIFKRDPGLPSIRRRFCREALVWQHLNSTFIVPFLGIDAESFPSFLCMVSPWMTHGTVLKHLGDHGRAGVNKRLYEVAQGLAYLHSQKIVHGDLRGSNILINDKWQACLTDFGLTVFNDVTATTFTSRREGSVRWMAPELHVPERFGLDRFRLTFETDIYAFGCVCLELYTGRPPFSTQHPAQLPDSAVMLKVIQGLRPERPTGEGEMSDQLWKMVEMCWSQHFADRLKTDEVVQFTKGLSDPNTKSLDLPVFAEVPKSLLPSDSLDWDDLKEHHSESALAESSQNKSLYLQDASPSTDSLFIEPLPPFPQNFTIGPLLTYPPTTGNSVPIYSDAEDEGEDAISEEDLEYADEILHNLVENPRIIITSLPPPPPPHADGILDSNLVEKAEIILAPPPPPSHNVSLLKLDVPTTHLPENLQLPDDSGLPEELEQYWDLIRELDVALDLDFSLTKKPETSKPVFVHPKTSSCSASSGSVIAVILTIYFTFYLVLYFFTLVYLILASLLLRPVMIGRL